MHLEEDSGMREKQTKRGGIRAEAGRDQKARAMQKSRGRRKRFIGAKAETEAEVEVEAEVGVLTVQKGGEKRREERGGR